MLEMRAIEKRFDAVVALNGAQLKSSAGEIRALLGSNGSGKSTMIKVLAGLVAPDRGKIFVDGQPVTILSGLDSKRLGIATAFQDLSLIPTMSVTDNILLGNEPLNSVGIVDTKQAQQTIRDLLDRFHIDCDPAAYVQTLPPSTQTMLEVAKAVSLHPRILLLDEVTAALHYDEIQVLFQILRELKAEGMSIIYVTHRMNEVFEICDSATIMRSGETVIDAPISELNLDDIVFYMTGQRPEVASADACCESTTEGELVLDVKDLEVYPKVWGISMKAYKGEIVGIGGLQGQGQPELIRVLLGAEKLAAGTIEFCGKPIHLKSPADAVSLGIGFVSGERGREAMFPLRTVEENIVAGKVAKGGIFQYLTPKSLRNFAKDAVEKYEIKIGALHHPASSLSGGNQQKLVIARWIAMNPVLLLLDDPTKGVDIHSRREIHKILRRCADEGMTILISSSDSEELLDISDRIYVFYEGSISDVLCDESKTADRLVAAMMGMNAANRKAGA
ncbi:MAG: sugar ABC transporter ATP-binding protein [Clostridiales bacterium]|nr:sugar ABC transporter ATP-binding protein [Clostridiales bacterium]